MNQQVTSLLRLGKRIAALAILIVGAVVLLTGVGAQGFPPLTLPPIDASAESCFINCDNKYWDCLQHCCVCTLQSGTTCYNWDCSNCGDCGSNTGISATQGYSQCLAGGSTNVPTDPWFPNSDGCFTRSSGFCIKPAACSRESARVYTACTTNANSSGCLNADGTVNDSCCQNEALQDYTACCWP